MGGLLLDLNSETLMLDSQIIKESSFYLDLLKNIQENNSKQYEFYKSYDNIPDFFKDIINKHINKDEEKLNWGFCRWVSSYKSDDPIILGIKYADKKRFLREEQDEKFFFENYLLPNFIIFIHNAQLRLQTQRASLVLTENRERLSHEIGQVATAIRSLDYLYNKNINKYKTFIEDKSEQNIYLIENIHKEFISKAKFYRKDVLRLFNSIEMLIKIFSTDYKPKSKYFDLWKDFMNMWNLSFNIASKGERKYIVLPFGDVECPESRYISTDPNLLQFILYNIINNAIKYSLVNTKITVKIEKNTNPEEYIFIVSNFGTYLDPNDKSIYESGVRHPEMKGIISTKKDYVAPGEGIGLFWCKMLVRKLGGDIIHTCNEKDKPVCKYNIPLMDPFFELYDNYTIFKELWDNKKKLGYIRADIPEPSYKEIRDEYEQLKRITGGVSQYNRIVTPWKKEKLRNVTFTQMSTDISIPTYEIAFIIKIPKMEEN